MPTLFVLGGANGVGKTTWYHLGIENKAINPELPFINIDLIVLPELGGYTAENLAKADQRFQPIAFLVSLLQVVAITLLSHPG